MEFKNKVILITENGRHDYVDLNGNKIEKPSVTALVNLIYPMSSEINEDILLMAQKRGTCVHKCMEDYANTGIMTHCKHGIKTHEELALKAKNCFDTLKKQYEFTEFYTELALEGEYYVGCFDLLFKTKDNEWILVDYKTTSYKFIDTKEKLNKQFLKEATQLELYSQMLPFEVNKHIIINPNKTKFHMYSITAYKEHALKNIEIIKELLYGKKGN